MTAKSSLDDEDFGLSLYQEACSNAFEELILWSIKQTFETVCLTNPKLVYSLDPGQCRPRCLRINIDYHGKPAIHEPPWIHSVREHIFDVTGLRGRANLVSVTVNEYVPGGTLSAHVDNPIFPEPIVILTLGADGVGRFARCAGAHVSLSPVTALPRRSVLVVSKEARNAMHEISTLSSEEVRYSIVFREAPR